KRADLVFSVTLKNSKKRAKILFLFEHKAQLGKDLFSQMLTYQAAIYSRRDDPVFPVLIYQGRGHYKGPRDFHEHYLRNLTPSVRAAFKKNILNFRPKILDFQSLRPTDSKDLTTRPILYIMRSVYSLNKATVERLLLIGKDLPLKERKALTEKAADYIRQYDPRFTWKVLQEIESKILDEKERIMPALKFSLDEAREEGLEEGLEKGREEGREEGLQKKSEEIVLNMLKEGADIRMICRFTRLTEGQVREIAQKHSIKK
ncbi:MAG: Rpn family recombination-promoting nuclease/putative transposase, partial [Bacteriovoracales bacterium]|nr:Rpn family recombination-promoting nuclease/putative transposase [Bacteriovoracales bacterium]